MAIEKYGVKWIGNLNDLQIELYCFRDGTLALGGQEDDRPFHFKQIVKMLWGPKSKKPYVWDPWTDKMLEAACDHKYVWLSGCAACVAGETVIPNPVTGENPTIKELYDAGSETTVMTLYGPSKASVPFVKGCEELYEVRLSNGSSFTCSAAHRVLTERGYAHAHELCVGKVLFGYERGLPDSTSGTGLSVRGEDALRSQKKAEGFQDDCLEGFCSDGGQLLAARESDQSFSPSQDDAQICSQYACDNGDAPDIESSRIHPLKLSDLLSSTRFGVRNSLSQTSPLLRSFLETPQRGACSSLSSLQSESGSCHPDKVQKSNPDSYEQHCLEQPFHYEALEHQVCEGDPEPSKFQFRFLQKQAACFQACETNPQSLYHGDESLSLSYGYTVTQVRVVSIRKTTKQVFYDLSVPGIEHYFAEGAIHHNSRKSTFAAVWAIVNWLCAPTTTLVLVASTSLTEARRRIWGQVEEMFTAGCEAMGLLAKGGTLPGRIIGSLGKIRTEDAGQKFSDLCGIQLVAGDPSHEKDAMKKIGFHNKRVIMILDELTDLSPTLVKAARANLAVNEWFQLIGIGNFASIYDPLGVSAEPIGGWGSVTPDFDQWETKDGLCLRFDGTRSPNVLLGRQLYPGQYGPEDLKNHRLLGEHTADVWRMCRSFPCPEADTDRVIAQSDLMKGDVRSLVKWKTLPVKCASLDPAFATGGDKAMAYFGEFGISIDDRPTLQITEAKQLKEDIRIRGENKALQVSKQFRDECESRGIDSRNSGYDGSGGGVVMDGLFFEIWKGNKLLAVQFGGAASDRPATIKDPRPSNKVFSNRVSELYFSCVDFILGNQIRGLPAQACAELTERRKAKDGNIIKHNRVESKKEMKLRTGGKSPDDADAFVILLEVVRVRLGFKAVGFEGGRKAAGLGWKQRVMLANRVYKNSSYEPEQIAA